VVESERAHQLVAAVHAHELAALHDLDAGAGEAGAEVWKAAPGGVEPPRADSKFLENACSQFYSAL
jgi:hypothetical protein